jgi:UDP-2,3-diacylglucosamine hydrolase
MQQAIESAVVDSDAFILGGDIFDFRWSQYSSHEETAEQGLRWLQDLVSLNPHCDFHYILGNHDANPELIHRLTGLAQRKSRFQVHPHLLRLEDSVFLHGDIIDANLPLNEQFHTALDQRRHRGEQRRRPPWIQHAMYDAVVKTRIHRWVAHAANTNPRVLDRVARYLAWAGFDQDAGVQHVYFGHTHRPLHRVPFAGLHFSNPGASIYGMDCKILTIGDDGGNDPYPQNGNAS